MNKTRFLQRLGRYGAVGIIAAAVHAGILLLLSQWISLSLANPVAFLAASLAGYVGHALVTFREETGGKHFARRWLVLQYAVNLSVCALLPLILGPMGAPDVAHRRIGIHADGAQCPYLEPRSAVQHPTTDTRRNATVAPCR